MMGSPITRIEIFHHPSTAKTRTSNNDTHKNKETEDEIPFQKRYNEDKFKGTVPAVCARLLHFLSFLHSSSFGSFCPPLKLLSLLLLPHFNFLSFQVVRGALSVFGPSTAGSFHTAIVTAIEEARRFTFYFPKEATEGRKRLFLREVNKTNH